MVLCGLTLLLLEQFSKLFFLFIKLYLVSSAPIFKIVYGFLYLWIDLLASLLIIPQNIALEGDADT